MGMPPDSGERSLEVLYEIQNTLNEIKVLLEKITTRPVDIYSGISNPYNGLEGYKKKKQDEVILFYDPH